MRNNSYASQNRLHLISCYPLFGEHCNEGGYQAQAKTGIPHSVNSGCVRGTLSSVRRLPTVRGGARLLQDSVRNVVMIPENNPAYETS